MLAKCGRNRPERPAGLPLEVVAFSEARHALGWSRQHAADFLGVDEDTILRWELCRTELKAWALLAICREAHGRVSIHFERTGT